MGQIFFGETFLWDLYLKRKNDVLLTFDDSSIPFVNNFDIFQIVLRLIQIMDKGLPKKIFSGTNLRGKNVVQLNFDDLYKLYASKIDVYSRSFLLVSLIKQFFLKKFFSGIFTLRKNIFK